MSNDDWRARALTAEAILCDLVALGPLYPADTRDLAAVHAAMERALKTIRDDHDPECPGPYCKMCNGEACALCGANGPPCDHDVDDRHRDGLKDR